MATGDDKMSQAFGEHVRMARLDKIGSLCPLPALTAYWTSPPALPRRVCDNKFLSFTINRTYCLAAVAMVMTYFLVMDIILFVRYQTVNLVSEAKAGAPDEIYSPFTHLSVKAIISDHVRHYIFTPSAEYFNAFTHFTKVFSFVTPNMVSLLHLICAFVSGKFIASENLQDRRIGVGLYVFRTWLDSFDGIVYRAHAGRYLQYDSVYSSYGYVVDALFDTLGGFFLSFGVLFYLFKRFGSDPYINLPMWLKSAYLSSDSPSLTNGHAVVSSRETHTYRYLFLKTLSYGVSLSVAGICWDRAVKGFTEVFQVNISDQSLSILQFEHSHSYMTLVLFTFWRFISGQTVLNYMLVAIYVDRIWEFLKWAQWLVLLVTLPLYTITVIYIRSIHSQLSL